MGALALRLLNALVSALPALLSWWDKRQAEKGQADAEARRAAVRDDPTGEWLRKFNSQANPGASGQAGTDQPGKDS